MKALFLDIDGVLNAHDPHPNGYCGLHPDKVARLDRIVAETGCRIVLASAWRYMIIEGDMTLKGFGHLLATHGASRATCEAIYASLPADGDLNDISDRGKNAASWLAWRREMVPVHAVAIDDGTSGHIIYPDGTDLGYEAVGIPVVRPAGKVGLTDADAGRAIELINQCDGVR